MAMELLHAAALFGLIVGLFGESLERYFMFLISFSLMRITMLLENALSATKLSATEQPSLQEGR